MERDPERKARECAEHLRRAEDIAYGSTANTAKALRTAAQGDPAGAAWLADRAEWMRTTGSTDNEQLTGSALERVAGAQAATVDNHGRDYDCIQLWEDTSRMTDELMFSASSGEMRPLRRVSLQEAGFRERDDLQEWVIQNPALLGGQVMVVTAEFDRWIGTGGVRPLDRLDLLAVRSDGTLLVAELKRGEAPDTVEMQAVKYAALSSEFPAAQLAEQHARFVTRRGETINEDEALERLFRFAPDLPDEGPRIPEVVLIAESFPAVVTATTVFLDRVGLAMRLITVGAYQTERGEFIVSAKQIYPLPELDELKVRPRSQERTRAATARGGVRVAQQLLDAGKPEPGTRLTMHPRRIPAEMREALIAWIAEDNQRAIAIWEPAADPAHPLRWVVDDNRYSLTGLVKEMARRVGFDLAQVAGPSLWAMPDGQWLPDYANEVHGASTTARVGAESGRPAADGMPQTTTPWPDR